MPKYGGPRRHQVIEEAAVVESKSAPTESGLAAAVEEYRKSVEREAERKAEEEAERMASNESVISAMMDGTWDAADEPPNFAAALRRGVASRSLSVGSAPIPPPPTDQTSPFQRREYRRKREVVSSVLEKLLANLGVLGELKVGDKLTTTPCGSFVIQKPTWWTKAMRTIKNPTRWQAYDNIENLVSTADQMTDEGGVSDMRVREALVYAVHGLRNLQRTYYDDVGFRKKMDVLLQRIQIHYELDEQQML